MDKNQKREMILELVAALSHRVRSVGRTNNLHEAALCEDETIDGQEWHFHVIYHEPSDMVHLRCAPLGGGPTNPIEAIFGGGRHEEEIEMHIPGAWLPSREMPPVA